MFEMNSRSYRVLTASLIYLVAIAGALTVATLRSRAKAKPAETELVLGHVNVVASTHECPLNTMFPGQEKSVLCPSIQ